MSAHGDTVESNAFSKVRSKLAKIDGFLAEFIGIGVADEKPPKAQSLIGPKITFVQYP